MSTTPKRRLGSGVDVLLSSGTTAPPPAVARDSELQHVPLDQLKPSPYQPRTDFDDEQIKTLADSLSERGAVQPVLVRKVGDQYELVAGERRLRAARMAGLESLPAVVREMSDDDAATLTLIENIQREDLNAIDEAQALQALSERLGKTHEQIAEQVGRARATVTNLIRLLELCAEVQQLVRSGKISMGHAKVLVSLPVARQKTLAQEIQREDLSVRETERRAKDSKSRKKNQDRPDADPDVVRLQQRLSDLLGCPVTLRPASKGGSMMLRYSDDDSLQGLLDRLGYSED